FFQAEDGIRDGHVTGVQTCALPIYLARARSPGPWAGVRLRNAARAPGRHQGARAPLSQGSATTPRAPGSAAAAASTSASWSRPVSCCNQASAAPLAESPASSRWPSIAARDATNPGGSGLGSVDLGSETLAVVPQETTGVVSDAPAPSTSHGRSPAPSTTEMPAGRPAPSPASPTDVVGAITGGSRPSIPAAVSGATVPSRA